MTFDSTALPPDEARAFLHALFPGGLRAPELLAEWCPEGWVRSPLFAAFHPPPETAYREYLELRETMRSLDCDMKRRKGPAAPVPDEGPDLSYEEFLREKGAAWAERPVEMDPVEEPAELLGMCLWDVFSDNHDVIAACGRGVNLGSFRGTAGEIADFFENGPRPAEKEEEEDDPWFRSEWAGGADYMRFYMGTHMIQGRTDLAPVYRLVFQRIKESGGDWRYSFPRLRLFSAGEIAENAGIPYDPSAALEREQERASREEETRRMQEKLDRGTLAAQREARSKPPPDIVRAYQEVYGRFPAGWPPDPYQVD